MSCLFCNMASSRVISENDLAYTIYDGFPVTEYHCLVIPKRHAATYFDLTPEERSASHILLVEMREQIQHQDLSVDGFNVGTNNGESAGQTVFHCHIHLIPRRTGDIANPRGGVRGVIPDKQQY
jgi:ATP adenylyltransferase